MRRLFLALTFIIFSVACCFADDNGKKSPEKKAPPAVLKIDTAQLPAQRNFNEKKINNYLKDQEFVYNKDDLPGETLWNRFWRWFWQMIDRKLFAAAGSRRFYFYLEVAIGIVFVLFILYKVTGINAVSVFRGKARDIPFAYSESIENIHEVNFDAEIEKAIAGHNYRLAVRLLYLYSLKQLNDAGIINWEAGKTNMAYLNELPEGERKRLFRILTRQFEYIWYGDFRVDSTSFTEIDTLFKQFKQNLG
ncbi:DUF4129 domain-containing protein [Mucilaginibacter kameinonensis]|uniref:DUF4129 domain-containing protein n=1 Tax=Mucilaginibacter kameinonensis TaxID=452286 RepID=UPI0013CE62AD|nr:DUF4129 domain-containing protein [Mucilaginibacter kameinonensis]